ERFVSYVRHDRISSSPTFMASPGATSPICRHSRRRGRNWSHFSKVLNSSQRITLHSTNLFCRHVVPCRACVRPRSLSGARCVWRVNSGGFVLRNYLTFV